MSNAREQYVRSQLKKYSSGDLELMMLDLLSRPTNSKPEVAAAEANMLNLVTDEHLSRQ